MNLQVERGDIYALVGEMAPEININENINGLYSYDDGEMYVKGRKQQFSNPSEANTEKVCI